MKICVVGSTNYDRIVTPHGEEKEGLGGILYNVLTLATLLGPKATICPVTNLGQDYYVELIKILSTHKNIDLSGITLNSTGTNIVHLQYRPDDQRDEVSYHKSRPIEYEDVRPFLKSKLILISFVTGFDLSWQTIARIRKNSNALMVLDVHSLASGMDKEGRRFYRPIKNWAELVENFDIIQASEHEFWMLVNRMARFRKRDFLKIAIKVLHQGPKMLLVTYGSRGSRVVFKGRQEYHCKWAPAQRVREVIDTTGCGDIFISGFLYEYLKSQDPVLANKLGNRLAGLRCKSAHLEDFLKLLSAEVGGQG